MSKSKGNVISPLEVSNEYGTDALRMGLVIGNTPGTDLNLDPRKIGAYKKFANKLWNIARFVISMTHDQDTNTTLTPADQEIEKQFQVITKDITHDLDEFRFHLAGEKIYHYIWHTFADEILEASKEILFQGSAIEKSSRITLLYRIFTNSLKLLHPFMPFVTEAIWQQLPTKECELLMVAQWPQMNSLK
jgi:valyl-tRNA synthetase